MKLMQIKNVRVYGLEASAIASGYPMMVDTPDEYEFEFIEDGIADEGEDLCLLPHLKRLDGLAQTPSGSGHDCATKGIIVQYDLTCNHVMLPQFMRYHFHDIVSSQSKMHRILKMDLVKSCDSFVNEFAIKGAQIEIDKYNEMVLANKSDDPSAFIYTPKEIQEQYERIMSNLPMGLELTMRITSNYLQLKSIYIQRHGHKMSFWREYCDWIKTLPMADTLIIKKSKGE
jgi:hypothetical protein